LLRTNVLLLAALTAVIAIGSKFVLRIGDKHVFNPTNFALVAMMLATDQEAGIPRLRHHGRPGAGSGQAGRRRQRLAPGDGVGNRLHVTPFDRPPSQKFPGGGSARSGQSKVSTAM
jgi:hypothetical protein